MIYTSNKSIAFFLTQLLQMDGRMACVCGKEHIFPSNKEESLRVAPKHPSDSTKKHNTGNPIYIFRINTICKGHLSDYISLRMDKKGLTLHFLGYYRFNHS
jgi:hypothetical protein